MKLLVALGGNALLPRGQLLSAENQLAAIRRAATQLARVAAVHDLVVTHGNGPQVGLLAMQAAAYAGVPPYPLDVLGAETEGMIGYLLEQELANLLPASRSVATLLSRVEVDLHDPAFDHPTKPIGPVFAAAQASALAAEHGWVFGPDGDGRRRLVASPRPLRVTGLVPLKWLLAQGAVVIAAGGGGIPVARSADGRSLHGVEAVIDKDLCSSLLACDLAADVLIIATDVSSVSMDWGLPTQRSLRQVTPQALAGLAFAAGTMGPKVEAACQFALATGRRAVIGLLDEIEAMLAGQAGTEVSVANFSPP